MTQLKIEPTDDRQLEIDHHAAVRRKLAGSFVTSPDREVMAEEIEDPDLAMLSELGVPFGHGHLFRRPEPHPVASAKRATRAGNDPPRVGRRANRWSFEEVSPSRGISVSSRLMSGVHGDGPRP